MSVILILEELDIIMEPLGKAHTTSSEVPDTTSLANIMVQVRERGSPVERDDEGGATITEVGAPTTRHTYRAHSINCTFNYVTYSKYCRIYLKLTWSTIGGSKCHKYFLQFFFIFAHNM